MAEPHCQAEKQRAVESFLSFSAGLEYPRWPLELFLEISNVCNLRCVMCKDFSALNRHTVNRGSPQGYLEVDDVKASLESFLPHVLWVHAFGQGEPTIHPQFFPFLEYLSEYDVLIDFFTNGMRLNERTCEQLVKQRVYRVTVSFSGINATQYENVYVNGKFASVLNGLALLKKIKEQEGSRYPEVFVNSLAFQHHIDALPEFVELMAEHGVALISVNKLSSYRFLPELHDHIAVCRPSMEGKIIQRAKQCASRVGIHLDTSSFERTTVSSETQKSLPLIPVESFKAYIQSTIKTEEQLSAVGSSLSRAIDSSIPRSAASVLRVEPPGKPVVPPCLEPFKTMYVFRNLRTRPCCFSGNTVSFGSLKSRTAEDIWNGDFYTLTRQGILAGRYPQLCDHCLKAFNRPIDHSFTMLALAYGLWFQRKFGTPFLPEGMDLVKQTPDSAGIFSRWQ